MAIVNHRNNTLSQVDIENINYVNRAFIDDLIGLSAQIIIACGVTSISTSTVAAAVNVTNDTVILCQSASISINPAPAGIYTTQISRPNANIAQSGWTGGYADIDDTQPNDSDFAYSDNNSVSVLEVSLSGLLPPIAGTKTISYRIARTNAGIVDGAGNAPLITARLYHGDKLISSDTAKSPDGTWTQHSWNPDTGAVTDWSALKLNFETEISGDTGAYGSAAYKVGGYPGTHEATWTSGAAANYSTGLIALHGGTYVQPVILEEASYGVTVSPIPSADKFYKTVGSDTLFLRVLQTHSAYTPNASITTAVIAVHGSSRDANRIFTNAKSLVNGKAGFAIFAPDFLDSASTTPSPESDQLSWGSSWPHGGLSVSGLPFRVSSHQIIEDLITQLRSNFVNLDLVYVIGHSAGGQYAQRFAMTNNDPTRIRIMVCNPSSYAYPGNLRWDGTAYTNPGVITCPAYNDWKYGTDNLASVSYVDAIGAAELKNRLEAANILYLAGELDTAAGDPDLDVTCPANLQGANRLDRALKYYGYLGLVYGNTVYSNHHFDIVPGSAHTEWKMITSPAARKWVLDGAAPSVPAPALVRQSVGMLGIDVSSLTITVNHASTAGNCLVATIALRTDTGRQVGSVTDTAGNAWVKGVHSSPGTASSTRTEIWYCTGANPVTSVTVNITGGAAIRCAALISEYSGVSKAATLINSAKKSEASVTSLETNPAFVFTRGALLLGSANSSTFGGRRVLDGANGFNALKDYSAPSSSANTRGVGVSFAEFEIPQASPDSIIFSNAANISVSNQDSGIITFHVVGCPSRSITLSPALASIQVGSDVVISSAISPISLSSFAASVALGNDIVISSSVKQIFISPMTSPVLQGENVNAVVKNIALTPNAAGVVLDAGVIISANTQPIIINAYQAGIVSNIAIGCTQSNIAISSLQSLVSQSNVISSQVKNIALSSNQCSFILDNIIFCNIASLQLSMMQVVIYSGGVFPIKSSKSINMTMYSGNIAMVKSSSSILMDPSIENIIL